jgi:hypothetical protein
MIISFAQECRNHASILRLKINKRCCGIASGIVVLISMMEFPLGSTQMKECKIGIQSQKLGL